MNAAAEPSLGSRALETNCCKVFCVQKRAWAKQSKILGQQSTPWAQQGRASARQGRVWAQLSRARGRQGKARTRRSRHFAQQGRARGQQSRARARQSNAFGQQSLTKGKGKSVFGPHRSGRIAFLVEISQAWLRCNKATPRRSKPLHFNETGSKNTPKLDGRKRGSTAQA